MTLYWNFWGNWTLTLKRAIRFEEGWKQYCYILLVLCENFSVSVWNLHVICCRDETGLNSNTNYTLILLFSLSFITFFTCHARKIIILWTFLPPISAHTMNLIKFSFIYYAENKELTISIKMTITVTSNGFQHMTKMIWRKP